MSALEDVLSKIKRGGILRHRYTKTNSTSREYGYYINLEGQECSDIEFRYCKGRVTGDALEKLGILEDLLDMITPEKFEEMIETRAKYGKR